MRIKLICLKVHVPVFLVRGLPVILFSRNRAGASLGVVREDDEVWEEVPGSNSVHIVFIVCVIRVDVRYVFDEDLLVIAGVE